MSKAYSRKKWMKQRALRAVRALVRRWVRRGLEEGIEMGGACWGFEGMRLGVVRDGFEGGWSGGGEMG